MCKITHEVAMTWVVSRSRSGCGVIRFKPCNGGAVGHPSAEGRRLAFRHKLFLDSSFPKKLHYK